MSDLAGLGRLLMVVGVLLVIGGAVLAFGGRIPILSSLGRLPGDLVIRRGNATIYVPIVTSILLSLILTLVMAVVLRRS
jgi:hypothetical protein